MNTTVKRRRLICILQHPQLVGREPPPPQLAIPARTLETSFAPVFNISNFLSKMVKKKKMQFQANALLHLGALGGLCVYFFVFFLTNLCLRLQKTRAVQGQRQCRRKLFQTSQ